MLAFYAEAQDLSHTAIKMQNEGYVNIQDLDSTIQVSLMYSRSDNFTGTVLYGDLSEAYLHPIAAKAIVKAQKRLKQLHPELSLKIYDAARPMHIQQKMWNKVKGTSKNIYVSNPANGGGLHNYGLAVDVTICNLKGDSIPMGTKIDFMGKAAHIDNEQHLVETKVMTREALANRLLLREVMRYAGFRPLRSEWWHFNFRTRAQARKYFKAIP